MAMAIAKPEPEARPGVMELRFTEQLVNYLDYRSTFYRYFQRISGYVTLYFFSTCFPADGHFNPDFVNCLPPMSPMCTTQNYTASFIKMRHYKTS